MGDLLLPIIPGTLPEGTCWPSNPDDFQKLILSLARAKFPSASGGGVIISQNAPATTDWDKLWVRVDSSGNLIRNYTHGGYGVWVSPHPVPPGTDLRYLFIGLETDLKTLDEGLDEPVTPVTGPFWEVDHNLDGRFPLAPGVVDADLTVAVKDKAGDSKVVLTADQIAQHKHLGAMRTRLANVDVAYTNFQGTEPITATDGKVEIDTNHYADFVHAYTDLNAVPATGVEGHPNMPPYYGTFVIKRTARVYFSVA